MKRNTAGQVIGAQMVSATDGSAFTGAVTVSVTIDAGTQAAGSVGSGACTHEGNGYHTYAPAQAETNGDLIAFTFTGTGAVPATVQVYTTFPQTGDTFAALPANFSDLAIAATNGRVKVQSNLAKNVASTASFVMKDSTNHAPATGLTVAANVSTDRGAFAAATNSVIEEGNGWYSIALTAAEMNGDEIMLYCTATGADATEVQIRTDP